MERYSIQRLVNSTIDILPSLPKTNIFYFNIEQVLQIITSYTSTTERQECSFDDLADDDTSFLVKWCNIDKGSASIIVSWINLRSEWMFNDLSIDDQLIMLNTLVAALTHQPRIGNVYHWSEYIDSDGDWVLEIDKGRYELYRENVENLTNVILAFSSRDYISETAKDDSLWDHEPHSYIFDSTFKV
jgi:hypothetical protein